MGVYVEKAVQLRNHPTVHYNCAQSVMVPFAEEMGCTEEAAYKLGAHLGSGMRHGSACGALAGALIVLGGMGYSDKAALSIIKEFKTGHGDTACRVLLRAATDRGEERKCHCDGLVLEMVEVIEQLIKT